MCAGARGRARHRREFGVALSDLSRCNAYGCATAPTPRLSPKPLGPEGFRAISVDFSRGFLARSERSSGNGVHMARERQDAGCWMADGERMGGVFGTRSGTGPSRTIRNAWTGLTARSADTEASGTSQTGQYFYERISRSASTAANTGSPAFLPMKVMCTGSDEIEVFPLVHLGDPPPTTERASKAGCPLGHVGNAASLCSRTRS